MKKLALVLILLFLMHFVNAEIGVLTQVENAYNINEKIPLKITVAHSQEIDGFIKSSIICDNSSLDYFISPYTFKTSPQDINIPDLRLTRNMVGRCSLEVSLFNNENNLLEKNIIKVFEVSSDLILNVNLNKDEFSPSDEIKVNGDIKNIRGQKLDKGTVKISFDNQEFSTELSNGEFSYIYKIPLDIKSNNHLLKINYNDGYENKASKEFNIFVNPKPTKLRLLLNNVDFLPGDQISIESLLYDQADDLIENNAEIKVYNPEEKLVRRGEYKLEFNLDQYAPPGVWIIKSNYDNFNIESGFNVLPVKKVEVYVEDGIVYVKNTGNVPYDGDVEIKAIGENGKEFIKKVTINPKESRIVKLSDELLQGVYDLDLVTEEQQQRFDDVAVPEKNDPLYLTGKAISTGVNSLIDKPFLLIAIILAIVLFFYFRTRNKNRNKFLREKESQEAYVFARKIEQEKIKKGIKPRRFDINEKEAKDFTNQMMKKIKEKKQDDQGYLHRKEKDDKGGLFGMFN